MALFTTVVWLFLIGNVNSDTNPDCNLQDGRQCTQLCINSDDINRCTCRPGYKLQNDNITCKSTLEVHSISPAFGPETGGTIVTIKGKNLLQDRSTVVNIGTDVICNIIWNNSTNSSISIQTPSASNIRSTTDMKLDITVVQTSIPLQATAPSGFTYKKDPVILAIRPLSSIQSGGIKLTVSGMNMMSVAKPKMNIYAVANNMHLTTFTSDCSLSTETEFFCPSPNMSRLLMNSSISRRDFQFFPGLTLDGITKYDYSGVNIPREARPSETCSSHPLSTVAPFTTLYPTMASMGPNCPPGGRCKPAGRPDPPVYPSFAPTIPTTTLWYPDPCPICASFAVFPNPTIHILEPEELRFRPYSPFNDKYITIKGEDLDQGISENDYQVSIGSFVCKDKRLSTTKLICVIEEETWEGPEDIVVQIGVTELNRFYVGKFVYEKNLWHHQVARSGFIAILVVVPIIAIAVLICVQLVRKAKREKRRQWFISAAKKNHKETPGGNEEHYLHPVKKPSGGIKRNIPPNDAAKNVRHLPKDSNSEAQGYLYIEPQAQGYLEPAVQGYLEPAVQGYLEPAAQGYLEPTAQGYLEPAAEGYLEPTVQDYLQPQKTGGHEYINTTTGSAPA